MTLAILVIGVIAAICIGVAITSKTMSATARTVIGFIGIVCMLVDALLLWAYVTTVINYNMEVRSAIEIRKMEVLRDMSDRKAEMLQGLGIRVEVEISPHGAEYWYETPLMSLSKETVVDMVRLCIQWPDFPDIPAQHGLSGWHDTDEYNFREMLRAFTQMVVNGGLAQAASGNQPAKWLIKAHEIPTLLGVSFKPDEQ